MSRDESYVLYILVLRSNSWSIFFIKNQSEAVEVDVG